jgi:Tfp pilus assembly protein PilF
LAISRSRRRAILVSAVVLLAASGFALYWYVIRKPEALPAPGDPRYEAYLSEFQIGTAYLDVELLPQAEEHLNKAIEMIPGEPAAWANRAVLKMRQHGRLSEAAADLNKARELAPDNADIEELAGFLAELDGKYAVAKQHFQKASAADPNNPRRLYKVADMIAKVADPGADAERLAIFDQILELRPDALAVLAEHATLAVRLNDNAALKRTIARMGKQAPSWTEKSLEQFNKVKKAATDPQQADLLDQIGGLGRVLMGEPNYAKVMQKINPTGAQVGNTLQTFIKLARPRSTPDEPDLKLIFEAKALAFPPEVMAKAWAGVLPIWLDGSHPPAVFVYDDIQVQRADGLGPKLTFEKGSIDTVLGIDWDNDFKTDIVLLGAGGLKFHHQNPDGSFTDVTAKTKLAADVLEDRYVGAWAVDIDFDGDLDIVLARVRGAPLLLRNNFDHTFTAQPIFEGVTDVRAFAWLDLDNDGAADAALLDEGGHLHIYMNQRAGVFTKRDAPDPNQKYVALAVADVNLDGVFDLIAVTESGAIIRISDRDNGKGWEVAELAQAPVYLPLKGAPRLLAVDLDNNGAIDLVLRTELGGAAWLADGKGGFHLLPADLPPGVADIVDLDGNGSLDLLGLDSKHHLTRHVATGKKGYQSFTIMPRSINAPGDNRINSFALGGELELRSGALVVKTPIDRPAIHFGLGSRKNVDLVRLDWGNGAFQYEFGHASGAIVVTNQRLKGSCPFLYAWDGGRMAFVADFCWSTPLGMYINAQDKGGFAQTVDWVKIGGDQLVPRDGVYDLRVNANLWETHYLDELGLMVVDHPPGTEMHVDERFFLQPTEPHIHLTGPSTPVGRAWDHLGQDVTDIVRQVDGNYLDHCGRGVYQGVTKDHWVEVDLGDDAPTTGTVYLLATGWIHPTDSSINYALAQNKSIKPAPLTLEIPDGKGGWKVGRGGLGFPAGKNKTCVLQLNGIESDKVTRRFRLRTNLEIYWDALHYASGLDASKCKQQRLPAQSAQLQFRGIVRMSQRNPSSPELPDYDDVIHRRQYWRDLTGFHTRFGDIRELIEKADDRFVIMNAGDEIRLTFKAPSVPPEGWKRDFIWVCDGWVKDGNLNTRWGKTVLPLPYHGMKDYDSPPARLEDDPVYRRFPMDWEKYHTRYVTPAEFERGLRTFKKPD